VKRHRKRMTGRPAAVKCGAAPVHRRQMVTCVPISTTRSVGRRK
jgi:hypothetical protein